MARTVAPILVALVLGGLAVGAALGARSGSQATGRCLVSATGALGDNAGGVAGGVAQKNGAKASLSLVCNLLATGVRIKIPGHSITMSTFVHALGGACTQATDTITCKMNVPMQKLGLKYGGWKDSFAWRFTPEDAASRDTTEGSCHVPVTVTLTNSGKTAYSKTTQTVCEFALGDALR